MQFKIPKHYLTRVILLDRANQLAEKVVVTAFSQDYGHYACDLGFNYSIKRYTEDCVTVMGYAYIKERYELAFYVNSVFPLTCCLYLSPENGKLLIEEFGMQ